VSEHVGIRARQALDVGFVAALQQPLDVALHRTQPELQLLSSQQPIFEAVRSLTRMPMRGPNSGLMVSRQPFGEDLIDRRRR
jgi:hypothetical protein